MRFAFIVGFLANVVLAMLSLAILPDRVAIHFGLDGMADNWAPSYANSLMLLGIYSALFFALYCSPRLVFLFPARWVNLPNKPFWLAPENHAQTVGKLSALMYQFGAAVFLFLFLTGLLAIQANLSDPMRLNVSLFLSFLVLFLGYSIVWCIVFFRSFRLPGKKDFVSKSS